MEETRNSNGGRKRQPNSSGRCEEEESKQKKCRSEGETSKDFIHVRARRGQATDSHSLAERVRREKISQRMKFLQDLVPGCNKVTGKALMLDEIINYVQSLQRQVEFLSMKLATVNPQSDLNFESLISKEMHQATSVLQGAMPSFEFYHPRIYTGSQVQLSTSLIENFPYEHSQLEPLWEEEVHGFDQSAEVLYSLFPSDQMKMEL